MALLQQPVIPTRPGSGKPLRIVVSETLSKLRASGEPLDPDYPVYLQDVRIFKDGTFNDIPNTKQDIRNIIKTTLEVNKEIGFIPFSKIDHNTYEQYKANPWASAYPYALGDVDLQSLRESDGYLISNFYIPYSVASLVEKGRLRSISVEIIPDGINPLNGKKYDNYLKAVALLGKNLEALYMVLNQYNDTSTRTVNLKYDKVLCYQLGENNMDLNMKMMSAINAICSKLGISMPMGDNPNDPNNTDTPDDNNPANEGDSEPDTNDENDMDYLKQPGAMAPQVPAIPPVPGQPQAGMPNPDMAMDNTILNLLKQIGAKMGIVTQPQAQVPAQTPFPPKTNQMAYSAKPNIISEDKNEMSTPNPEKPVDQDELRKSIESEMEKKYAAKFTALEDENNKLAASVGGLLSDKQMLTTKEFVYSLKNDDNGLLLLPNMEQKTIDIIASLSPAKEKHYSAGAEVEDSPQERVKNYVKELVESYQPYLKAFSLKEQGKVRLPNASETGAAPIANNVDPASELSFTRIQEYSAKNNLPFNTPDNDVNAKNYRACLSAVEVMENAN